MWSAVVPVWNEEGRIGKVLTHLSLLPINKIIVIANGCRDQTINEINRFNDARLDLHIFPSKLGIDVPRAIGAKIALNYDSQGVLFIDGDMTGKLEFRMKELMAGIENGLDLALTNCYPSIPYRYYHAATICRFRAKLNRELGLFQRIGIASPSHGPHGVSRQFLKTIPLKELAIPPVALTLAGIFQLKIGVATRIPHHELGSPPRSSKHEEKVFQTIIGDHLEALSLVKAKPRSRFYQGQEFLGYHLERRFGTLESFLLL